MTRSGIAIRIANRIAELATRVATVQNPLKNAVVLGRNPDGTLVVEDGQGGCANTQPRSGLVVTGQRTIIGLSPKVTQGSPFTQGSPSSKVTQGSPSSKVTQGSPSSGRSVGSFLAADAVSFPVVAAPFVRTDSSAAVTEVPGFYTIPGTFVRYDGSRYFYVYSASLNQIRRWDPTIEDFDSGWSVANPEADGIADPIAVAGGKVFVRATSHIYRIDIATQAIDKTLTSADLAATMVNNVDYGPQAIEATTDLVMLAIRPDEYELAQMMEGFNFALTSSTFGDGGMGGSGYFDADILNARTTCFDGSKIWLVPFSSGFPLKAGVLILDPASPSGTFVHTTVIQPPICPSATSGRAWCGFTGPGPAYAFSAKLYDQSLVDHQTVPVPFRPSSVAATGTKLIAVNPIDPGTGYPSILGISLMDITSGAVLESHPTAAAFDCASGGDILVVTDGT